MKRGLDLAVSGILALVAWWGFAAGCGDQKGGKPKSGKPKSYDMAGGKAMSRPSAGAAARRAPRPTTKEIAAARRTVASFKRSTVLAGHNGFVRGVAFLADGKRLVSGAWDDTVRLWDTATGKALTTLRPDQGKVQSLRVSRDGARFATATHEGGATLWDAATGKAMRQVHTRPKGTPSYQGQGHSVAFSPDGKRLATSVSLGGGEIGLWNVGDGSQIWVITKKRLKATSLVFSPDGRWIYGSTVSGRVLRIAADSGKVSWSVNTDALRANAVALSADGRWLACSTSTMDGGSVQLRRASTGVLVKTLGKHAGHAGPLVFLPKGRILLTGGGDATINAFLVPSGEGLGSLPAPTKGVESLALSPDGKVLAAGGRDFKIYLYRR